MFHNFGLVPAAAICVVLQIIWKDSSDFKLQNSDLLDCEYKKDENLHSSYKHHVALSWEGLVSFRRMKKGI